MESTVRFGSHAVKIAEPQKKKYDVPDHPELATCERVLSWRRRVLSLTSHDVVFCASSVVVCHNHSTGSQRFFTGHKDEVTAVCTTAKQAASGDVTGIVLVWSLVSLTVKRRLEYHKTPVLALQFLPHQRPFLVSCALSGNGDHPLALWQLGRQDPSLRPSRVTNGGKNEIMGLYAMKTEGGGFVSYGAHHLKMWVPHLLAPTEPITMQRAAFGQGYTLGCVTCVAEVSAGLVCGTDTGDVFHLQVSKDALVARRICGSIASPKTSVVLLLDGADKTTLAVFKDGTKVNCGEETVRSSIWTSGNETIRPILIAVTHESSIAMASASHLLFCPSHKLSMQSLLIQPPSLKMEHLSVQGTRTAVGTPEGCFVLQDSFLEVEYPGVVTAVLLVDGFIAIAMGKSLRVINCDEKKTIGEKQLPSSVCCLAAFEGMFAAGCDNGSVHFFDGPDLKQGSAKMVMCHERPISAMAFAGQFLYTCSEGNLIIFDAVYGRRLAPNDELHDTANELLPTQFTLPYSFATRGAWGPQYTGERKFSAAGNVLAVTHDKDVDLFPFPTGPNAVAPTTLPRIHTAPLCQVLLVGQRLWSMSNNTLISWRLPKREAMERRPVEKTCTPRVTPRGIDKAVVVENKENEGDNERARRQAKLLESRMLSNRSIDLAHGGETVEDPNAVGRREKIDSQREKGERLSPKVGTTVAGAQKTPTVANAQTPQRKRENITSVSAGQGGRAPSFQSTGMFRHKTRLTDTAFEIEVRCLRHLSKVTKNAFRRQVTFFSDDVDFVVKVPWGYDVDQLEAEKNFEEGYCFALVPKASWTDGNDEL